MKKKPIPSTSKPKENPFDTFANARKKHEVVNRRVKGEDRNVGRALAKSIEERKTKLLADYKSSKKSNVFADKRFGEQDADLSLEDKMFLRFQRERQKRIRNNGSQFNLSDAAEEILTHKGRALSDANYADNDDLSDNSDGDEEGGSGNLDRQVVDSLHFGGGFVQANRDAQEGYKMGRLDALQEIVMKSKLAKLQRKETKLAQEEEREKLDRDFQELLGTSMLDMKPLKRERGIRRGELDEAEEGDEDDFGYNQSLQAMAFEVKAKPSDRTKSDEELAVEAKARLEKLEAERLKRMKSTYDPDQVDADDALNGKSSAKRKKTGKSADSGQLNDDCQDNTFGAKQERVDSRGSKVRFGGGDDDAPYEDEEDDLEDEEWEEDELDEEEDDKEEDDEVEDDQNENSDNDEDDDGEGDDEDGDGDDEELDYDDDDNEDGSDEEVADDTEFTENNNGRHYHRRGKASSSTSAAQGANDKMPLIITCPADMDEFYSLVEQYTTCAEDVSEMIDRIAAWHSVHLPGAEGVANKVVIHNFLDILLKHFVRVGDTLPFCSTPEDLRSLTGQLDHLCKTIFRLSNDIPDAVGSLWGRTLKIFQSQLQKKLRDYVEPASLDASEINSSGSCWPALGRLLLFRLAGMVFSSSDYRHAVLGPVSLFLCQCLTQCPVVSTSDIASGLLAVSIVTDFAKGTDRFIPETYTFLRSVVAMFILRPEETATHTSSLIDDAERARRQLAQAANYPSQATFNPLFLSGLRTNAAGVIGRSVPTTSPWTSFIRSTEVNDEERNSIAASLLFTTYKLIEILSDKVKTSVSYPEIMKPVLSTLRAVRPHDDSLRLPIDLLTAHANLIETLEANTRDIESTRTPLMWRKPKLFVIESKNPRYQVDYKMKKDMDPDADRVKLKQLTRDKKREHKAAMRELRRDSDFLEQERFREKRAALDAQRAERHKNFAWMEEQQATINQQVRKGKSLLKGGGSGVHKKARVSR